MADPGIDEIRAIRHAMSAECGHDVRKLAAYLRSAEEELRKSGKFQFATPPETIPKKATKKRRKRAINMRS